MTRPCSLFSRLLATFSSGTHRGTSPRQYKSADQPPNLPLVLVKSPAGSSESHIGMITDHRLLAFFSAFARSSGAAVARDATLSDMSPILSAHCRYRR
jgi:hypothetical protein